MAETSLSKRTFTWAPRALAVISCALALLAAQPAGVGAGAVRKGTVAVREGGVAAVEVTERVTVARAVRETSRAAGWREQTLLSSARHWRILATMEIVQRLLAGELRGTERQVLPAVWFEEACVGAAAEPVKVAGRVEAAGVGMAVVEREFAIGHCLLAPPIS